MNFAELKNRIASRPRPQAHFSADAYPEAKRRRFAGFDVRIENPAGSIRSGVDRKGNRWQTMMHNDYGFLSRGTGADGEGLDVFLGKNELAPNVHVVHQNNPETGMYDEDKVLLGMDSPEQAKAAYLANYNSPKFFRSVTVIPAETFRNMLTNGKTGGAHWKKKAGRKLDAAAMFSADQFDVDWDESKHPRGGFTKNRGEFSPITAEKFWHHPSGRVLNVPSSRYEHHAERIARSPEQFDLDPDDVASEISAVGSDETLVPLAKAKGWVRASADETEFRFEADKFSDAIASAREAYSQKGYFPESLLIDAKDHSRFATSDPLTIRKILKSKAGATNFSAESGPQFDADEDDGERWITIGAQPGEDGKKHGGTHVEINKETGEIEKGPKNLQHKNVANLPKREPERKPIVTGMPHVPHFMQKPGQHQPVQSPPATPKPFGATPMGQLKTKMAANRGGPPPIEIDADLKSSLGHGGQILLPAPGGKFDPFMEEAYQRAADRNGIELGKFQVNAATQTASAKVTKKAATPPLPKQSPAQPNTVQAPTALPGNPPAPQPTSPSQPDPATTNDGQSNPPEVQGVKEQQQAQTPPATVQPEPKPELTPEQVANHPLFDKATGKPIEPAPQTPQMYQPPAQAAPAPREMAPQQPVAPQSGQDDDLATVQPGGTPTPGEAIPPQPDHAPHEKLGKLLNGRVGFDQSVSRDTIQGAHDRLQSLNQQHPGIGKMLAKSGTSANFHRGEVASPNGDSIQGLYQSHPGDGNSIDVGAGTDFSKTAGKNLAQGPADSFVHELGHHLQSQIAKTSDPGSKEWKELYESKMPDEWGAVVSPYGGSKAAELFSESLLKRSDPARYGPLPPEIEAYFNKHLGSQGSGATPSGEAIPPQPPIHQHIAKALDAHKAMVDAHKGVIDALNAGTLHGNAPEEPEGPPAAEEPGRADHPAQPEQAMPEEPQEQLPTANEPEPAQPESPAATPPAQPPEPPATTAQAPQPKRPTSEAFHKRLQELRKQNPTMPRLKAWDQVAQELGGTPATSQPAAPVPPSRNGLAVDSTPQKPSEPVAPLESQRKAPPKPVPASPAKAAEPAPIPDKAKEMEEYQRRTREVGQKRLDSGGIPLDHNQLPQSPNVTSHLPADLTTASDADLKKAQYDARKLMRDVQNGHAVMSKADQAHLKQIDAEILRRHPPKPPVNMPAVGTPYDAAVEEWWEKNPTAPRNRRSTGSRPATPRPKPEDYPREWPNQNQQTATATKPATAPVESAPTPEQAGVANQSQAVKPKAEKPASKSAIEKQLLEHHDKVQGKGTLSDDDAQWIQSHSAGDPFTYYSKEKGDMPGEIKAMIADNPALRRLFKGTTDVKEAGFSDAYGADPKRFEGIAESIGGNKIKAALRTAETSNDPEIKLTADIYKASQESITPAKARGMMAAATRAKRQLQNIPKEERAAAEANVQAMIDRAQHAKKQAVGQDVVTVGPTTFQQGDTFSIHGHDMTVSMDEDGNELLRDHGVLADTPVDAIHGMKLPIDKGSLKHEEESALGDVGYEPWNEPAAEENPPEPEPQTPIQSAYDRQRERDANVSIGENARVAGVPNHPLPQPGLPEIPNGHEMEPDTFRHQLEQEAGRGISPIEAEDKHAQVVAKAIEDGEIVPDHIRAHYGHPKEDEPDTERKVPLPTEGQIREAEQRLTGAQKLKQRIAESRARRGATSRPEPVAETPEPPKTPIESLKDKMKAKGENQTDPVMEKIKSMSPEAAEHLQALNKSHARLMEIESMGSQFPGRAIQKEQHQLIEDVKRHKAKLKSLVGVNLSHQLDAPPAATPSKPSPTPLQALKDKMQEKREPIAEPKAAEPPREPLAPIRTSKQLGMFNRDESGQHQEIGGLTGSQQGLFAPAHEPVKEPERPREVVGSAEANKPENTAEMFPTEAKQSEPENTTPPHIQELHAMRGDDREGTIQSILSASRKPEPPVQEVIELKGSDGNWYRPNGFPYGVTSTGEKRPKGFVVADKDGRTYGTALPTKEAILARHNEREDQNAADFRKNLEEMNPERLAEQSDYWKKEQEKQGRLNAPMPTQKPATPLSKLKDKMQEKREPAKQEPSSGTPSSPIPPSVLDHISNKYKSDAKIAHAKNYAQYLANGMVGTMPRDRGLLSGDVRQSIESEIKSKFRDAAKSTKKSRPSNAKLGAHQLSDFQPGRDKVVRRDGKTYVTDTSGQYADTEVKHDAVNETHEANMRKLNPAQLDRMAGEVKGSPHISDEGKRERLDLIDKIRKDPAYNAQHFGAKPAETPSHEERVSKLTPEMLKSYAGMTPEKQAKMRAAFGHGGDDEGLKRAIEKAAGTGKPNHQARVAKLSSGMIRDYANSSPEGQAQFREGFGHGGDDAGLKSAFDEAVGKARTESTPAPTNRERPDFNPEMLSKVAADKPSQLTPSHVERIMGNARDRRNTEEMRNWITSHPEIGERTKQRARDWQVEGSSEGFSADSDFSPLACLKERMRLNRELQYA